MKQSRAKGTRFVTTDYVVGETATLLLARGHRRLVPAFFESLLASRACRLVWMDAERFERTRAFLLRGLKRRWSFTDCSSFTVMSELGIRKAVTKDSDYAAAGFQALLR
jgi:predicted nucleic acid-binding protein